jgi:hypothetical protein
MLHTLGHLSRTTTNFTKTRVASALMAPTIDHLRRAPPSFMRLLTAEARQANGPGDT